MTDKSSKLPKVTTIKSTMDAVQRFKDNYEYFSCQHPGDEDLCLQVDKDIQLKIEESKTPAERAAWMSVWSEWSDCAA